MFEFTEQHLAARELHNAAYQEPAHKAVYERFGGAGDAVVWKNESGRRDEVAWLGQFRPRTCPEAMRSAASTSGLPFLDLPTNWKVLFGVAGLVAEELLSGETDDAGVIADAVLLKVSYDDASATDLEAMGITDIDNHRLSVEDVEEAVRILREEWVVVKREAEYLIESAVDEG